MKAKKTAPGRAVAFKAGAVAGAAAIATAAMLASHEAAAGPRSIASDSPAAHVMQASADYGGERLLDVLYQLRSFDRSGPNATAESMERDAADMKAAAMHETNAQLAADMAAPAGRHGGTSLAFGGGDPAAAVDRVLIDSMEALAALDKKYNTMDRLIGGLAVQANAAADADSPAPRR